MSILMHFILTILYKSVIILDTILNGIEFTTFTCGIEIPRDSQEVIETEESFNFFVFFFGGGEYVFAKL